MTTKVEGGLDEPEELEPEQGTLALASEEDRATVADWEKAAAAVLRKARRLGEDDSDELVWERLTRRTLDDIPVTPLGTRDLVADLATQGRPVRVGAWDIRAHLAQPDAKAGNEALLVDLDGGVTSVWVEVDGAEQVAPLLAGVLLDLAPVVLQAPDAPVAAARALLDLAERNGTDLAPGTNLGVDGTADAADLVAVAELARDAGVLGVVVDGTAVHDRGASDAQELGHSMAVAVRALRTLTGAGLTVGEAAGVIEFRYAATDEQFPTIAKLRAARRLWARVLQLSGATPAPQRQHAVTSRPMMSRYDPYVNMLRTTVAAFAAGVGGADAVTVLPFDSPLGRPEAFGRRIARNTSHLLIDEAHLAKVADPAGGAYAVEKLTDDLARAAWEVFGALESGEPLEPRIAETVARRDAEVARRQRPLTGLTEFPNLAEEPLQREPDGQFDGVRSWGAAFEAMRDEPTGTIFLASMGTVAAHTARVTFATNLFAAGGIAVRYEGALADVGEVVAAYDGEAVVCLCGTDAAYAEWGADLVSALREAGARHLIVAGKPGDLGVDDSCAMGIDALEFLTRTREVLSGTRADTRSGTDEGKTQA